MQKYDVIIIGAGASGLMCAAAAARRGRKVLVCDQADQAGKKILVSGGGRCNFTNLDVRAVHYISHNPHFVKSAIKRFTPWDFIDLLERHQIPWHERAHGQLFCNESAKAIVDMLLQECRQAGATLQLKTTIESVVHSTAGGFTLRTSRGEYRCEALVVATGGLSIPTLGASPLGYRLAQQFEIAVYPPSAGLVPFTVQPVDKQNLAPLSGIAIEAVVSIDGVAFQENVLFTHRGLSGPAILQLSNYWQPGQKITIDWLPHHPIASLLENARHVHPKQQLKTMLAQHLPARVITALLPATLGDTPLAQLGKAQMESVTQCIHCWNIIPNGTEGYRTAEVTRGGVDCDAISSKTFESKTVAGLYFIGEVLDVTGWLGGYNLHWAWASGWCAGQYA